MKFIKNFALISALTLVSFTSAAQNITARATTIDSAEGQIAAQAKEANADYKIITTLNKNGVYMFAKLIK
ncbi:hypothetical protein Z042_13080 [Chania multitudinisentens RB-25]|uniref:YdgH/BhsA/McbA-like domain-containing protein n=1 Tax=Chania multitudinisentens RB-25 TaxID=1441930 RepID=W0L9R9_9GAMM|nr:hypothetical protein [Chania multitudinisentens]AHG20456.1 hypothetical protein Z042_13080 [Chania multitudinisentens RB-25]